jgi:hypothetical protein
MHGCTAGGMRWLPSVMRHATENSLSHTASTRPARLGEGACIASVATQARGSRGALALWGGNRYDSGLRLTLPIGDRWRCTDQTVPAPPRAGPRTRNTKTKKPRETRVQASFTVQVTALCLPQVRVVRPRLTGRSRSRGALGEQTITPPDRGTSASRLERSRSGAVRTSSVTARHEH